MRMTYLGENPAARSNPLTPVPAPNSRIILSLKILLEESFVKFLDK